MIIKYDNGMYKSTSKRQEYTAQKLYYSFKDYSPTMGYNFNQIDGLLIININMLINNNPVEFKYTLNYKGFII